MTQAVSKPSIGSFGRKIDSRSTTPAHDRYAAAVISILLLREGVGFWRFYTAKTHTGPGGSYPARGAGSSRICSG